MKLEHEFIQLPVLFNVERLRQEVSTIASESWQPHHEGFKGNYSIPLVSVGGTENNAFKGPMAATPLLENSPYLKTVLASFGEVIGRSRLMGLAPGAQVPVHSDINYHWYKRVRIHVPITTTDDVQFYCGDKQLHMQAGEAWIFDSWKYHRVENNSDIFRIHLVIDICGSSRFWNLARKGNVPGQPETTPVSKFKRIDDPINCKIETERYNAPLVMSPGEMDGLANDLLVELNAATGNDETEKQVFIDVVRGFCQDWRVLWCKYGLQEAGWKHYHALRESAFNRVKKYDHTLKLVNGTQAPRMFLFCMIDPALNVEVKDQFLIAEGSENSSAVPLKADPETSASEQHKSPVKSVHSRNAPCPCGSGKRYKNCHGKLA